MIGGAALAAFAPGASASSGSKIAITQTPIAAMSTCTSAAASLGYTALSDGSTFRVKVRASAPLCDPITATAVVYAMPKGGAVWPQTLTESKSFTISDASVTEVTFTKDCTPAQFDIVTGATPATISPLGERHGPLLIPDTGTAFQDPGIKCTPSVSTTVATTAAPSTTTASTTTLVDNTGTGNTTTTAAVVAGVNTVPTTSKPSAAPSVLDTSSTRGGSDPSTPSSLAVTGASSRSTAYAGVALFVVGVLLIVASRRRLVPAVRMITSSASVSPNSPFGLD